MFNRKTAIPNLLGATLTLTGCGGGEAPGPDSLMGAAHEAFCMKMNACEQPEGSIRWSSEDYERCLEDVPFYDFVSQYVSKDCDAVMASYFACATVLPCDALVYFNDYDFMSAEHDACVEEVVSSDPDFVYSCYSTLVRFSL